MYLKHDKTLQLVGECPTQDVSRVSESLSARILHHPNSPLLDPIFSYKLDTGLERHTFQFSPNAKSWWFVFFLKFYGPFLHHTIRSSNLSNKSRDSIALANPVNPVTQSKSQLLDEKGCSCKFPGELCRVIWPPRWWWWWWWWWSLFGLTNHFIFLKRPRKIPGIYLLGGEVVKTCEINFDSYAIYIACLLFWMMLDTYHLWFSNQVAHSPWRGLTWLFQPFALYHRLNSWWVRNRSLRVRMRFEFI